MESIMDSEKKEFSQWWLLIILLIVVSSVILSITGAGSKIFSTAVEREVFEQSFQYSQAQRQRIARYEAQLTELRGQLRNPGFNDTTKSNIKSQISAIKIQLATARSMD